MLCGGCVDQRKLRHADVSYKNARADRNFGPYCHVYQKEVRALTMHMQDTKYGYARQTKEVKSLLYVQYIT